MLGNDENIKKIGHFIELYRDIISGSVLLIIFVSMFISTFGIRKIVASNIGPSFMPRTISIVMIAICLGIIIEGIMNLRKVSMNSAADKILGKKKEEETINTKAVLLTLFCIVLYFVLFNFLGFIITTALYLFAQMCILAGKRYRNILFFLIISVVLPVIVYYTFRLAFNLMLPSGLLG